MPERSRPTGDVRPGRTRPRSFRVLVRTQVVPGTPAEVFPFFADPFNLERITPGWLRFRIVTPPPIVMGPGLRIDYRLRLRGMPIRWQSEILAWDPPHRFIDMQQRGPYRWWHHEHRFEPHPGGTLMTDEVEYAATGGPLVERLFVNAELRRIFDFRAHALRELLPARGPGVHAGA